MCIRRLRTTHTNTLARNYLFLFFYGWFKGILLSIVSISGYSVKTAELYIIRMGSPKKKTALGRCYVGGTLFRIDICTWCDDDEEELHCTAQLRKKSRLINALFMTLMFGFLNATRTINSNGAN